MSPKIPTRSKKKSLESLTRLLRLTKNLEKDLEKLSWLLPPYLTVPYSILRRLQGVRLDLEALERAVRSYPEGPFFPKM